MEKKQISCRDQTSTYERFTYETPKEIKAELDNVQHIQRLRLYNWMNEFK